MLPGQISKAIAIFALTVATVLLFSRSVSAEPNNQQQRTATSAPATLVGTMTIAFDERSLGELGWAVEVRGQLDEGPAGEFAVLSAEAMNGAAAPTASINKADSLEIQTTGAVAILGQTGRFVVSNPSVRRTESGRWIVAGIEEEGGQWLPAFDLFDVLVTSGTSSSSPEILLSADFVVTDELAQFLIEPQTAGSFLGTLAIELQPAGAEGAEPVSPTGAPQPIPPPDATIAGGIGPDVIVGDLHQVQWWGRVGDVAAFSVGTVSCNLGDERLLWIANTNRHPVIAQNMYRLKNGRFEQIGMSWLKHGFYALSQSLCPYPGGCRASDGTYLGIGCSDPYSASLNGGSALTSANLGPRYQVNPVTGVFPYSYTRPPCTGVLCRRIQVRVADIDPALNVGASYFVDGHYITQDDAAAGNDNNNASYRPIFVRQICPVSCCSACLATTPNPPYCLSACDPSCPSTCNEWGIGLSGSTQRTQPAIMAWQASDGTVRIRNIDISGDGRLILGYKVSPLEPGWWHYEYALQNLNSDRAARSFSIELGPDVSVREIGFHDVDEHSGSPYDSTDWAVTDAERGARRVLSWSTAPFNVNVNANALHWGSLYNFRFDANMPPTSGEVVMGLFKPGDPTEVAVPAAVPAAVVQILSSNPPDGAIDARQPSQVDGSNPTGIFQFELTVNIFAQFVRGSDFMVSQEGGFGPAPAVAGTYLMGEQTVVVALSSPIEVGAWTTLTYKPTGQGIHVGYLPGDVNGDGTTSPFDLLALIDALNGVGPVRTMLSLDIDRSGFVNSVDILREVDLLNGAGEFDVYNGMSLP